MYQKTFLIVISVFVLYSCSCNDKRLDPLAEEIEELESLEQDYLVTDVDIILDSTDVSVYKISGGNCRISIQFKW